MEELPAVEPAITVLVVEDEVDLQRLAVRVLAAAGFRSIGATTAEQGAELVDGLPTVDLLFTDVMLPGEDGIALARRLRRRWPDLPVLVSTGQPLAWITDAVADEGYGFLPKPYTPSKLLARVAELLGQAMTDAVDGSSSTKSAPPPRACR